MRVLIVGHDFDFSAGDGISRYSYEIYNGIRKYADVRTIATGRLPRPVRAFMKIKARNVDIVHLMYPDAAKVDKGKARMLIMWHDLRLFSKYSAENQYRYKPRLSERLNIASSLIRKWGYENYLSSDADLFNSSQSMSELKDYFSARKAYDRRKLYRITPLGVEKTFLDSKLWKGRRKDFAYIGSIHLKHKNLQGLLSIFDKVAASSDSKLHIFTSSPGAQELLDEKIKHFENLSERNVVLHIRASDSEIAGYLPKLAAYLQLTKHEGQGIPILEAMAAGTNAITLKDATIPSEICKYAIRVSEDKAAVTLLRLAGKPTPAPKKAIDYARSFTWEKTVSETLKAYRSILSK
jgi:glycosyltransferase involved in cell wall biosynthesis